MFLAAGGGVHANKIIGGWTLLTNAANDGRNAESIPLLLAAGADPDKPDIEGDLPLDVALQKKNGRAAAYLTADK
ncbi:MAG: ankyrin repeat domain-containing protein [Synergistaceae bacterium]|jgi:ankyrin repeat protein|nr:ankyrin repeat domain-containing protein [Synergistaceae bacterium]